MQKAELFNTHAFIKELVKAGMSEKQAEVLAEHQLTMLETHIATKADVLDLKSDIKSVKSDLEWVKKLLLGVGAAVFIASIKFIFA